MLRVVGLDVWEGRRAGVHCSRAKAALMNSLDLEAKSVGAFC